MCLGVRLRWALNSPTYTHRRVARDRGTESDSQSQPACTWHASAAWSLAQRERHKQASWAAPRRGQSSWAPTRCARTSTSAQSAPAHARRPHSPHLPPLPEQPRVPPTITPRGVLLVQVSCDVHGVAKRPLHDHELVSRAHLLLGGAELPSRLPQRSAEMCDCNRTRDARSRCPPSPERADTRRAHPATPASPGPRNVGDTF